MKNKIKQVFILSAGLGTRLKPLTDNTPKIMLPIAPNLPLLEYSILRFRDQGFRDFVLNIHFFPEKITSYFGDGKKFGVKIIYSDETEKLMETGGALKKAEKLLDDDFILFYGDQLQFLDFSILNDCYSSLDDDAFGILYLKHSEFPKDADLAEIDKNTNKIINWFSRPHKNENYDENVFANTGIYALSKKIINYILPDVSISLDREIMPSLIKDGAGFYGITTDEKILDIGTPEKYEIAKKYYAEKIKDIKNL